MSEFELGIRRGPEGIRKHKTEEERIKMPVVDIEKELSLAARKRENESENSEDNLDTPRIDHVLKFEEERKRAFDVIVPKVVSLVEDIKDKIKAEGRELKDFSLNGEMEDIKLETLKRIFDDKEIVHMMQMNKESLPIHVETELGIKLLREREEIAHMISEDENRGKLHSALQSVRETYDHLNISVAKENPPTELVGRCGSLFIDSLRENDLAVSQAYEAKGEYISHVGKVVVKLNDSTKRELSPEDMAAFKYGTIQSKSFQQEMFGGGESRSPKLIDLEKIEKMQIGFSQFERIKGEMKVIYRNLDAGVTELLVRFSNSRENAN